jgi:hypothetical protein
MILLALTHRYVKTAMLCLSEWTVHLSLDHLERPSLADIERLLDSMSLISSRHTTVYLNLAVCIDLDRFQNLLLRVR